MFLSCLSMWHTGTAVTFEVVCDALILSMLRKTPHVHSLSHTSQLPPTLGLPGMGQRE